MFSEPEKEKTLTDAEKADLIKLERIKCQKR